MTENKNEADGREKDRFGLGAFVCVFNKEYNKVLMLYRNAEKRARNGADWGNVGGLVEFGETSIQGAVREVYEEIGLSLLPKDLKLISIKETLNFMPHLQAVHFVYSTAISESTEIALNAHCITQELESYKWFDMADLPDKMIDSKEEMKRWRDLAKSDYYILNLSRGR